MAVSRMMKLPTVLVPILMIFAAGCAATHASHDGSGPSQPGYDIAAMEGDILSDALARYGQALVDQTLRSPRHLIAKRTFGGIPVPPPPGEPFPPPPVPAMALMRWADGGWQVAENGSWRTARQEPVREIESIATSQGFEDEPAHIPPCPDYGSVSILLKVPGHRKEVRNSGCAGLSDRIVARALES